MVGLLFVKDTPLPPKTQTPAFAGVKKVIS